MRIISPVFKNNEFIPLNYTCEGQNISPSLEFFDIPENAKSLVLIMDDPDAPTGVWTHWLLWNIEPQIFSIAANTIPSGAVEGMNSFKKTNYGGPCPPAGIHRYFFKLYALDTMLNLDFSADRFALEKVMDGHILDKAELVGLYRRR